MPGKKHGYRGESSPEDQQGEAITSRNVQDVVANLDKASRAGLLGLWKDLHGTPPPRSISQPLLRQILAFDLQLQAAGGWPPGIRARLTRAEGEARRPTVPAPIAGGRLLREWNGTTHVVEVTADGYLWQDRTWRSLSAIAREITGAHWSGPRFFGLTTPRTRAAASGAATSTRQGPLRPSDASIPSAQRKTRAARGWTAEGRRA